MIRTVDVEVNAANPSMPLSEFCSFINSPSQVRVRNVPRSVGTWKITAVYVAVAYPDNTSHAPACTLTGGIWTATIPGSALPGFSSFGYQIIADGIDEHGDPVVGYVLGAGDVRILDRDGTITVGGTTYYLHYVAVPSENPEIGDVSPFNGILKWYDGTAWQGFDNPAALQLTPVYSQTPTYGDDWTYDGLGEGITVARSPEFHEASGPIPAYWDMEIFDGTQGFVLEDYDSGSTASTLHFGTSGGAITATRARTDIIGYTLGDQTAKPLQPQGEYASANALRYDLITITTGQLQDRAAQKVTLSAASTTLTLPALTDLTGKVSDFGIDVINSYEESGTPAAASFQLGGTLGTNYNLIVPKGETWSDMTALAAGEMAAFYFTLSAFQIGDLPTWEVAKKVVELVPVPTAP